VVVSSGVEFSFLLGPSGVFTYFFVFLSSNKILAKVFCRLSKKSHVLLVMVYRYNY
jgi:hypothetical protein